jgi:methanogenic corrinoid protein MtbC1
MNPETTAAAQINNRRDALATTIMERLYARWPGRWDAFTERDREKSVQDVAYHLTYLGEALRAADPTLFVDYVAWVKVLFAGLDFSDDVLAETLQVTKEVLAETLPAEPASVAVAYVESGLDRAADAPDTAPAHMAAEAPLSDLAVAYLDLLLQRERRRASQLILDAVEEGTAVREIYLHVFQPAQREVGRLWQQNQLSVAQEHYCTAATQLIMSQLYPHIFAGERNGRRLVAACVGEELHELGIRMVADFFEMEGWDTYYLGANAPTASILDSLDEYDADLLALSTTILGHVAQIREIIEQVHHRERGNGVKILVGGYPFNVSPELWRKVGADGYAVDAQEAIQAANELVSENE